MSDQALVFIPVEEEREQFAAELDALAQANGLNLTTLTFSVEAAPKAKAAATEEEGTGDAAPAAPAGAAKASKGGLNYNAAIVGSYESIEKFLKQLYQTKRYTTIKTFEVTTTAPVTGAVDPAAPATETLINLSISGSILTKPVNKKFAKDQKFSTDIWKFLVDRTTTVPTTSATNPFAPF